MTLPTSGTITYNNFNTEAGRASGTNIDMGWIYSNTKTGQQSYAINNYYSKAWYQRNMDGNCNNGNCVVTDCNCGTLNCLNCLNCNNINCTNCDTRSWFQNNCNCNPTYNCTQNTHSYNCDCDCVCPTCFPGDALVTMADGSQKRIDQIQVGDIVDGGYGYKNRVQMYHEIPLGDWPMYIINSRHRTTGEHKHLTTDGWAVITLPTGTKKTKLLMTVDNNGKKEWHTNTKFERTATHQLKVGMTLITTDGYELIESIEVDAAFDKNEKVYTLCTDGSHTHIVSGNLIVGAWVRDIDFDYDTWTPIERHDDAITTSSFISSLYNNRILEAA